MLVSCLSLVVNQTYNWNTVHVSWDRNILPDVKLYVYDVYRLLFYIYDVYCLNLRCYCLLFYIYDVYCLQWHLYLPLVPLTKRPRSELSYAQSDYCTKLKKIKEQIDFLIKSVGWSLPFPCLLPWKFLCIKEFKTLVIFGY